MKGEVMDPVTAGMLLYIMQSAAAVPVTILVGYLIKNSPKVLAWFKRRLLGRNILVLGHSRAGKTSFYYYLKENLFATTHKYPRTSKAMKMGSFTVDKKGGTRFDVSRGLDVSGELPISLQIEYIKQKKPEAILIMLSPLSREEGIGAAEEWLPATQWLSDFVDHFRQTIANDREVRKKLRVMLVILNKSDLVSPEMAERICGELRGIIQRELKELVGERTKDIKVIPCTLRREKGGELAANTVIVELISCLRNKTQLVNN